jgi:hypothetical protein
MDAVSSKVYGAVPALVPSGAALLGWPRQPDEVAMRVRIEYCTQ